MKNSLTQRRIECLELGNINNLNDFKYGELSLISPFFWKNHIRTILDARDYLKNLEYLGLEHAEVWKFIPKSESIKQMTQEIIDNNKFILCLPGRTKCSMDRIIKIARTIQNNLQANNDTNIYVGCYENNEYDTQYHNNKLEDSTYFSDDTMIFVKFLQILPKICKKISVIKIEN